MYAINKPWRPPWMMVDTLVFPFFLYCQYCVVDQKPVYLLSVLLPSHFYTHTHLLHHLIIELNFRPLIKQQTHDRKVEIQTVCVVKIYSNLVCLLKFYVTIFLVILFPFGLHWTEFIWFGRCLIRSFFSCFLLFHFRCKILSRFIQFKMSYQMKKKTLVTVHGLLQRENFWLLQLNWCE